MALVVVKFNIKTTEADGASVCRQFAGRPQPGDPRFQNGDITVAEHIAGVKSSGIPSADLNDLDRRQVNLYDTYANALAFGATGLITLTKLVDRLTNNVTGSAITQTAPTDFHQSQAGMVGFSADANGDLVLGIDDGGAPPRTVYAMSIGGRQNGPMPVIVGS